MMQFKKKIEKTKEHLNSGKINYEYIQKDKSKKINTKFIAGLAIIIIYACLTY